MNLFMKALKEAWHGKKVIKQYINGRVEELYREYVLIFCENNDELNNLAIRYVPDMVKSDTKKYNAIDKERVRIHCICQNENIDNLDICNLPYECEVDECSKEDIDAIIRFKALKYYGHKNVLIISLDRPHNRDISNLVEQGAINLEDAVKHILLHIPYDEKGEMLK